MHKAGISDKGRSKPGQQRQQQQLTRQQMAVIVAKANNEKKKATSKESTHVVLATSKSKPQKVVSSAEPKVKVSREDIWKMFEYIDQKKWKVVLTIIKTFPEEVATLTLPQVACNDDDKEGDGKALSHGRE